MTICEQVGKQTHRHIHMITTKVEIHTSHIHIHSFKQKRRHHQAHCDVVFSVCISIVLFRSSLFAVERYCFRVTSLSMCRDIFDSKSSIIRKHTHRYISCTLTRRVSIPLYGIVKYTVCSERSDHNFTCVLRPQST